MSRRSAVVAMLALFVAAGCDRHPPAGTDSPAGRLDAAAIAAGLVADPAAPLAGVWKGDTGRLCIVPGEGQARRIGLIVDDPDGQGDGCLAGGEVRRRGDRLSIVMRGCRIEARIAGDRIALPAMLEEGCARLCRRGATLAGMAVDRLGESVSEATMMRSRDGRQPCLSRPALLDVDVKVK